MNRFPWFGVVLAVLLVGLVAAGAYAAGSHWRHDDGRVVQVIESPSGQAPDGTGPVVRVIDTDRGWGHGGFFPGGLSRQETLQVLRGPVGLRSPSGL